MFGGGLTKWNMTQPPATPKTFLITGILTVLPVWLCCMCHVVKISEELQLCFPLSAPHHMAGNSTASSIYTESECAGLNAYCSSSTQEHPPSHAHTTNLHEPNSAGNFPMLLTNSKRTEGFQEPWYRGVHYAQLCTGVQPRQSGIVESFHGCRVSERLYLVFY